VFDAAQITSLNQEFAKMTTRFLKDFFTAFFDTFDKNKPLANLKDISAYSPSGEVFQAVSENVLMGFVGALYKVLNTHLGVEKPVSKSHQALYYAQRTTASLSASRLLLVELNQFYLSEVKEPAEDLTAQMPLATKVRALLSKLSEADITDELEQSGATASSYKIKSSSDSFSKLKEFEVESPTKAIAEFGKFILEKLAEMEKIPTNKFGGNEADVMLKYSQNLLSKLTEKAEHWCPPADKKSCAMM
jgi:hypothetical protein